MLAKVLLLALCCSVAVCSAADDVVLEDFSKPVHTWVENNDPVMGGRSSGTTRIAGGVLIFNGSVVDVPALRAPGFITSMTTDKTRWANAEGCKALAMELKSNTNYTGYRVSFGYARALVCHKFFAYGYKAPFQAPPVGQFGRVVIPFNAFSDCWDDATGKIITPCSEKPQFCPPPSELENLATLSLWGEGVGGNVHLEVKSISATNC